MSDLAERVAAPTREASPASAGRARDGRADGGPRLLPRQDGVQAFRASFAQERLWVLETIAPGRGVANIAGAVRAVGRLDVARVVRALESVVARHESLRTTFVAMDGVLTQVVSPHAAVSFAVRRVDGASVEAREAGARRAIAVEAEEPFDVSRGPLVRVRVFPITETCHLVVVVLHHLVADAWSMATLVRDVAAAYRADRGVSDGPGDRTSALQYADVAAWQRDAVRSERSAASCAYWCRQLADAPPPPVLGDDGHGAGMAFVAHSLSRGAVAGLRALGREGRTTLFAIGLAAWQLVLGRWLARRDVVVLSPVADRERPELADVIGFLVDVVALRLRWDGDLRFREIVGRAHDVVRDAIRHRGVPFEEVLAALGIPRGHVRAPLSPFGYGLERFDDAPLALPDLELVPLPLERATTRTDLTLVVAEAGHGITLRAEYDRGRVDEATAGALLASVAQVLERVAADPELRVSELAPSMVVASRSQVLRLPPAGATVWEAFAGHAARTPTAVAVRVGTERLTYEALRRRAERVAASLQAAGVGVGALVAVWGERGGHLAASLLGILRAGAVYVPLDPRWPSARVADVLRESGTGVVLAPTKSPAALSAARGPEDAWRIVAVDGGADEAVADSAGDAVRVAPSALAYVLYTSGTTGTPKGAMVEHAGLMNHLRAKIALLGLGPADRVAQTAAAGFDVSLWQYLAAWLVGGEVVVLDDATVRDPARLRADVVRHRVTVLEVVPAVMQLLLEAPAEVGAPALRALRWIVATGDALPPALCRAWLARHPAIPIVNAYGPTECADDVAHHVVRTPPAPDAVRVPIGTPIPGVALHVLDEELRPVAAGAVGELCVSGIAVGRGYLRDPVRTAAAFVARGATRLYRTGDAARRLPDGTFECLGRRDRQVKIRGVRVEPEEVEVVVRRHPAVRQAAVVPRRGPDGTDRLVACIEAHATPVHLAEDLRRWLSARLPEALVPATFELHAALPLTANGKIDHAALGAPRSASAGPPGAVPAPAAAPISAVERVLGEIWREVLGIAACPIDDDFFALGGDSLASIRVVASARRHGLLLTPRQMFEERTIARLAAVVVAVAVDPAEQGPVVGPVAATPVQRMFLEADLDGRAHYNLSTLLEVDERLRPAWLGLAVEHLMRHHDALRARWRHDAGVWQQTIAGLEGPVPFTCVDLSAASDHDAAASIERRADEAQASLRLAEGPILRVVLFDLGPARPSRLLVVVHHLACDVVSWPILLEDLATVYGQLRDGEAVALPAKTTSVQAWARRLAALAETADASAELAYWQGECLEPGASLVPAGGPSGAPAVADAVVVRVVVGPRETAGVIAAAAALGCTVEAMLLTSLATAVTEARGGDAVLVYLERHGRAAIVPGCDVARTVGWFTAVFPVRVTLAPSRDPVASLARVDAHVRAVPHGGVGYGVLRYAENAAASLLAALPRPAISVNYLGRVDPPEGAGWRLAREAPGREVGVAGARPTLLDVTAHLLGGRLHVAFAYDRVRCARAAMEEVADRTLDVLRAIAARTPGAPHVPEER